MQLSGSVPKLSQCGDIPPGRALARDGLSLRLSVAKKCPWGIRLRSGRSDVRRYFFVA